MKKICALFLCSSLILLSAGCSSNKTRVAEGGIIGGVVGAAAGGIIGHQMGRGSEGAAIGAATGAAAGLLIGSQINKPQTAANTQGTQATQSVQPGANLNQMSMQQVVDLSKQGINEDVIIDKIRLSNSKFILVPADIEYLKKEGVSGKVIAEMQSK